MQPKVDLRLNASEQELVRVLTPEEREAVIDQLLQHVRDDLEWLLALAAARPAAR